MLRIMISMALIGGTILYPIVIYFSLQTFSPRLIAVFIGLVAILSLLAKSKATYNIRLLVPLAVVTLICLISAISNQPDLMLYLPVLISLNLFITFGYSLLRPPSMIEVFARRMTPMAFKHEQIRYCRQVTLTWVIFFALNGTLSGLTACCTAIETWSLYNGLIAYGAIGLLFATEWIYRHWRFRRYVGLPTDFLLKRIFPPRDA